MKVVVLVLLVALPAFADDAPKALCLEPQQRVVLAQKLTTLEAENASLRESVKASPSMGLIVVLALAGIAVGAAAGYGVARATK